MDPEEIAYRVAEIKTLMDKPASQANAKRVLLLTAALHESVIGPLTERIMRGREYVKKDPSWKGFLADLEELQDSVQMLIWEVESQCDTVLAAQIIFDGKEIEDSGDSNIAGRAELRSDVGRPVRIGDSEGGSEAGNSGTSGGAEEGPKRPRPRFASPGYDLV
jgi:hypothetical protein